MFLYRRKTHGKKILSTSELLRIQSRVERETGIRHGRDIKVGQDSYLYHGILPATASDETDRDVFIKILLSDNPEKRTQFEREAWISSHFRHDHLIRKEFSRTISLGRRFKRAYMLVLEYLDGIDVAGLLDYLALSGEKLKPALVIEIGMKVLKALDEAHLIQDRHGKAMSVVHADVSPQNILLSRKGQVKLIDFGIAKISGNDQQVERAARLGKPAYIAPEQVYADQFDHRADLYSMGVVLAELMTGKRLVAAGDLENGHAMDLVERYQKRLREAKIDVSIRQILLKAMHFEAEKRFASAKEFIKALEDYAHQRHLVFHSEGISRIVTEVVKYFTDVETKQATSRVRSESGESHIEDQRDKNKSGEQTAVRKLTIGLKSMTPYLAGAIGIMIVIWGWRIWLDSNLATSVEQESQALNPVHEAITDNSVKTTDSPIRKEVSADKTENETNKTTTPEKRVALQPTPVIKPPELAHQKILGHGTLFIGASPWAEVTIPGYATNRSIPFTIKLKEGWYKVAARYQSEDGKWQYLSKSVQIRPAKQTKCLAFFEDGKRMRCD